MSPPHPQRPPLERVLLQLAEERGASKTFCPSEAARRQWPDEWRSHMPEVHQAVRSLWSEGHLEVLQKGEAADPRHAKGPIRLRRKTP